MQPAGLSPQDRVLTVASGLRVLSGFLFDMPLDVFQVDGVSSLCRLMADELDRAWEEQAD